MAASFEGLRRFAQQGLEASQCSPPSLLLGCLRLAQCALNLQACFVLTSVLSWSSSVQLCMRGVVFFASSRAVTEQQKLSVQIDNLLIIL